ncbi:MAG: DNA repair protein RecN [Bacteroidetes bacterium]|nr:DNA repair protein RecN [Bacteroidota bacterium]
MLSRLHIKNYVLIDSLNVEFNKGLSIITGETGAGKSILLGALGLVLGNRADSSSLLNKNNKCIIEAEFDILNYNLKDFFYANELDYESKTIIRREINAEGKSRAFVNDSPVNLSVLKELSGFLVDVHSQHETLTLNNSYFQLDVLDIYAGIKDAVTVYKRDFLSYSRLKDKLNTLIEEEKKAKADADYWQFQFDELSTANLIEGEKEKAEQELEALNNIEQIKTAISQSTNLLKDGDANIIAAIAQLVSSMNAVSKFHPALNELSNRIKASQVELKDIAQELENVQDEFVFNPERVEILNERLNAIYRLEQKHHTSSVTELIQIKNDFENKLSVFTTLESDIQKLTAEIIQQKNKLLEQAKFLSEKRQKAAPKIEKEIKEMLASTAMPDAKLQIEINSKEENLSATGIDTIQYLFTANKGIKLEVLSKVASGGELSRLMLSIKALIAKLVALPSIIFDEIDSGISGEVANKVGDLVRKISDNHQVIAITHLPQMASKGDAHFLVYKNTHGNTTTSGLKLLNKEERINEIAKMISGNEVTQASLKNAKELLNK